MSTPNASLVKYAHINLPDNDLMYEQVIRLADLTELVEGLKVDIARSFINADEISAYRLACEHILAQLEAHGKE